MKILYLAQRNPYPPNKGEKIRTYHQIKHLVDQGHNLTMLCPSESGRELDAIDEIKRDLGIHAHSRALPHKALRMLKGLLAGKPLSVTNFYSHQLQEQLDRELVSGNYDTLVCTSSSMAEYVFRSTIYQKQIAKREVKLLLDFMDLDSDKWGQYAHKSRLPMQWLYLREQKLLSHYESRIQREFDACFFISKAEVDLFEHCFGTREKIHILGNGIDIEEFTPSPEPKTDLKSPVLLFTGVMDYKPNVDAVVWLANHVWPRLRSEYPKSQFIIAGMNPNTHIQRLGMLDGIEVTGYIDDILPYYHSSNIFVAPFQIARGVQNKILQAFACGLPVIASTMGAEGIEYQDGSDILLADDADTFIRHIEALVTNRELRESLVDNALDLVRQKYSWSGHLHVLDETLRQLNTLQAKQQD